LSFSDGVAHELHGAGVGASGEDEGVSGRGGRQQARFESLLLPALHTEVFGATDQRQGQMRSKV